MFSQILILYPVPSYRLEVAIHRLYSALLNLVSTSQQLMVPLSITLLSQNHSYCHYPLSRLPYLVYVPLSNYHFYLLRCDGGDTLSLSNHYFHPNVSFLLRTLNEALTPAPLIAHHSQLVLLLQFPHFLSSPTIHY